MIKGIDHIAIAVEKHRRGDRALRENARAPAPPSRAVESQGVETATSRSAAPRSSSFRERPRIPHPEVHRDEGPRDPPYRLRGRRCRRSDLRLKKKEIRLIDETPKRGKKTRASPSSIRNPRRRSSSRWWNARKRCDPRDTPHGRLRIRIETEDKKTPAASRRAGVFCFPNRTRRGRLLELDPLCERKFLRPVDRVRLAAHVRLPRIRTGLAAAAVSFSPPNAPPISRPTCRCSRSRYRSRNPRATGTARPEQFVVKIADDRPCGTSLCHATASSHFLCTR